MKWTQDCKENGIINMHLYACIILKHKIYDAIEFIVKKKILFFVLQLYTYHSFFCDTSFFSIPYKQHTTQIKNEHITMIHGWPLHTCCLKIQIKAGKETVKSFFKINCYTSKDIYILTLHLNNIYVILSCNSIYTKSWQIEQ